MSTHSTKSALPRLFAALADPGRLRIFRLILEQRAPNICVGDCARFLGVTDSASSQHLRILAEAGLLKREKRGQRVCYRVRADSSSVRALIALIR